MRLDDLCVLSIDGGTTRTRAWATVGDRVVASESVVAGARDGAREGSARPVREALEDLVRRIAEECRGQRQPTPALAVAAGMIASAEGLVEVVHVEAPAGTSDLARGAVAQRSPGFESMPLVLIPGVRSGPAATDGETVRFCDVMRGEETLAVGLARQGRLEAGGVVLSLGSHWKAVRVDERGRVTGSVTTLSGELIRAVQERTILASALPHDWPPDLPTAWVEAGRRRGREGGLSRALFEVRLLQQRADSQPGDRLAFLVGAALAADEAVLVPPSAGGTRPIVLAGTSPLVDVWAASLKERGLRPVVLGEDERAAAFRAGCRAVLEQGRIERRGDGLSWEPPR